MLKFFVANSGSHFPVSAIKWISDEKTSEGRMMPYWEVNFGENRVPAIIGLSQYREITNPIIAIVPAEPGHDVVHVILCGKPDGVDDWVSRTPVIAWQFRQGGDVWPVTARGERDGMMRPVAVILPDGRVHDPLEDAIHDTLASYAAEYRESQMARTPSTPEEQV